MSFSGWVRHSHMFITEIKHIISTNMMSNNDLLHQTYFSFLPLMADFHFLFMSWSFALAWSLQCCLDSIHSLDVWNNWSACQELTFKQNGRLFICMELPGILLSLLLSCNECYMAFSLVLLLIQTLNPFSKREHRKKLFCCQIIRRAALFFFSKLRLVIFLPIMVHVTCIIYRFSHG